jgi:uncharacterized protein
MPRPRSFRMISQNPKVTFYKPQGVPLRTLKIVEITHEEWEALRLKNTESLSQTEAAAQMKTSQSTFQRIFTSAQKKLSTAVVQGMAIKIVKE